jgi:hypothetical protein
MTHHWLGLRINPKSIGMITMVSYVTYIGYKLGLKFDNDDLCKEPPTIDDKTVHVSHFIRISK